MSYPATGEFSLYKARMLHMAYLGVLFFLFILFLPEGSSIVMHTSLSLLLLAVFTLICWPVFELLVPGILKEKSNFMILALLAWLLLSTLALQYSLSWQQSFYPKTLQTSALFPALHGSNYLQALETVLVIILPSAALAMYRASAASSTPGGREAALMNQPLNILKLNVDHTFLFNFVNTVFSLNLTNPQMTPDLILLFSDHLRYQLNYHNAESIALYKESLAVETYLTLQRAKFNDRADIHYSASGRIKGHNVPPLVPFYRYRQVSVIGVQLKSRKTVSSCTCGCRQ